MFNFQITRVSSLKVVQTEEFIAHEFVTFNENCTKFPKNTQNILQISQLEDPIIFKIIHQTV